MTAILSQPQYVKSVICRVSAILFQETVLLLLKEAMLKAAAKSHGFLIDGYPRELDQGLRFEKEVGAERGLQWVSGSGMSVKN